MAKLNGNDIKIVYIDKETGVENEIICLAENQLQETHHDEDSFQQSVKHKMFLATHDAVRKLNPLNL